MATISFKVSDDEARAIRARARLECLTVSPASGDGCGETPDCYQPVAMPAHRGDHL